LKNINDKVKKNDIRNILSDLDRIEDGGLTQFCGLLSRYIESTTFLFFIDEIDDINSASNINICPEGLSSNNPYERLYELWKLLLVFLEEDHIFLLVAGKSSSLSMIGKGLIDVNGSSSSPTRFRHIVLPHLEIKHYELSLRNTKVAVAYDVKERVSYIYQLSAYNILWYRLNFDQELVKEFMQQVDIYSKGIPRILHYITEALLSTKRKLTTKKSIISFIEDDCLQLQKNFRSSCQFCS
jgi:hypothetical protein